MAKGVAMNRRPPLDDRELLKLLEAGQGQSESARTLGYPVGTVTARVKKLRDRGILTPGGVVDWEALETWEREHQPKTYRTRSHDVTPSLVESPQETPRKPTPKAHTLTDDETQVLKELAVWWKEQRTHAQSPQLPTPEGPRTRRHILVNDAIWEKTKNQGKREGRSVGEIVSQALQAYLTGPDEP